MVDEGGENTLIAPGSSVSFDVNPRPVSGLARPSAGREIVAVAVLTTVALALRVVRLEFQPLWWDEGYSVWFATHPLGQMAALTAQDIHPPLYYAFLHGWTSPLGTGPVVLRLFSVFAGIMAALHG